jgi:hypothetical protein
VRDDRDETKAVTDDTAAKLAAQNQTIAAQLADLAKQLGADAASDAVAERQLQAIVAEATNT